MQDRDFSFKTIDFLEKNDKIELITGGHSGAVLYKVKRNDELYFLKIMEGNLKQNLERIKEIVRIYEAVEVPSLKILGYGKVKNTTKFYVIYNFIEGSNAKYFYCHKNEIKAFGNKIGEECLKLAQFRSFDQDILQPYDILKNSKQAIEHFEQIEKDISASEILKQYFTKREIEQYKEKMIAFSKIVEKQKRNLIHGDIKRSNFMINNESYVFVDVESMEFSYDIMNFEYQMIWALMDDNKKEKEFLTGYFDAIYENNRPEEFNKQVVFIVLFNFFKEASGRYKRRNEEKSKEFYVKSKYLFSQIEKIDLNKEIII